MVTLHQNEFVPLSPRTTVEVMGDDSGLNIAPTPCCNQYFDDSNIDDDSKETKSRKKIRRTTCLSTVSIMFAFGLILSVVVSGIHTFESARMHSTSEDDQKPNMLVQNKRVWIALTELCKALQCVDAVISRSYFIVIGYFIYALARYPRKQFISRFQFWMTYLIGSNIGSELGSLLANTLLGRIDWVEEVLFGVVWYALVGYLFFQWIKSENQSKKLNGDGNEVQDRKCVWVGPAIC